MEIVEYFLVEKKLKINGPDIYTDAIQNKTAYNFEIFQFLHETMHIKLTEHTCDSDDIDYIMDTIIYKKEFQMMKYAYEEMNLTNDFYSLKKLILLKDMQFLKYAHEYMNDFLNVYNIHETNQKYCEELKKNIYSSR